MRYSSNKVDPGYAIWNALYSEGKRFTVFLNDEEEQNCVTADEESGYIRRCKLDADGCLYCNPDNTVAEEDIYGNVRVVVSDP
jgi:hypothetical protein